MTRSAFLLVALFGIGLLAVGASVAAASGGSEPPEPGRPITPGARGARVPDAPVGGKAIPMEPVIAGRTPQLVTEEAVRAYLVTHRHPNNVGPAAAIETIELLTPGQVDSKLQTTTSLAPERQLWVVTLRGTFHVNAPRGLKGADGSTGYLVFDALTGNVLLEGVADLR